MITSKRKIFIKRKCFPVKKFRFGQRDLSVDLYTVSSYKTHRIELQSVEATNNVIFYIIYKFSLYFWYQVFLLYHMFIVIQKSFTEVRRVLMLVMKFKEIEKEDYRQT